jgi:polysaccharide deacetylase 2 family uncharacterized protein YibQ
MPKRIAWLAAFGLLIWANVLWASVPQGSAPSSENSKGRLAIIIDDIGYNLTLGKRTADLTGSFTLAVLPLTPHGPELAERAHKRGKEIMLHAPMSNRHNYPLGRGALVSNMEQAEFLKVLRNNLASIPHIKGVNNHMGSLLTEQATPMAWLMAELQRQQLYFVDSRTTAQTQALNMAQQIHLPSRKRDVFLDDKRDTELIRQQLLRALQLAQQQGSAIAIGHPYPETLELLEQLPPLLAKYQVQLVPASALMPANIARPGSHPRSCMAPPSSLWPKIWAPIDPFAMEFPFKLQ